MVFVARTLHAVKRELGKGTLGAIITRIPLAKYNAQYVHNGQKLTPGKRDIIISQSTLRHCKKRKYTGKVLEYSEIAICDYK